MFWLFGDSGFPFLFLLVCQIDLCLYLVNVSLLFLFDLFLRFLNFGGIVCVWEADFEIIICYFNRFIWISLLFSLYYFLWSKYLLISFESWASYLFLNVRASQLGLCIWQFDWYLFWSFLALILHSNGLSCSFIKLPLFLWVRHFVNVSYRIS